MLIFQITDTTASRPQTKHEAREAPEVTTGMMQGLVPQQGPWARRRMQLRGSGWVRSGAQSGISPSRL